MNVTTEVVLDGTGTPLATADPCGPTAAATTAEPTFAASRRGSDIAWRVGFKRMFDVGTSLLALIMLAPLFLIIALAIKITDPGPIFYRHRRLSLGGNPIEILKFRTMHARFSTGERFGGRTDADVFAEFGRPELAEKFSERQKLRDDPRISRIGSWLRRSSLDELPQLWNVLKGELSTVGPRPIVQRELAWYGEASHLLLESKPGLTGLWQVSGRSELSYEDRVKLDLRYVESWSLLLDLKIVLRTVPAVLGGRGAY
jgi:lipopolysaccharide/colanic/teichoic acid biosynthesis glycosyltransferase